MEFEICPTCGIVQNGLTMHIHSDGSFVTHHKPDLTEEEFLEMLNWLDQEFEEHLIQSYNEYMEELRSL